MSVLQRLVHDLLLELWVTDPCVFAFRLQSHLDVAPQIIALSFQFVVSLQGMVAKSVVLTFKSAVLKLLVVCGLGHSVPLAESFQDSLRSAACVDTDRTEVPLALFDF